MVTGARGKETSTKPLRRWAFHNLPGGNASLAHMNDKFCAALLSVLRLNCSILFCKDTLCHCHTNSKSAVARRFSSVKSLKNMWQFLIAYAVSLILNLNFAVYRLFRPANIKIATVFHMLDAIFQDISNCLCTPAKITLKAVCVISIQTKLHTMQVHGNRKRLCTM